MELSNFMTFCANEISGKLEVRQVTSTPAYFVLKKNLPLPPRKDPLPYIKNTECADTPSGG